AEAESADLEALVKDLMRLRADELVAEKAADVKPYGLERPRARWRLLAGENELLTLLVGSSEKEKDEKAKGKERPRAYARLGAGELVFLLDPALTAKTLAEYRSRKLWAPLDAVQIEKVTFGYPKTPFTLHKVGTDWEVEGKPGM